MSDAIVLVASDPHWSAAYALARDEILELLRPRRYSSTISARPPCLG